MKPLDVHRLKCVDESGRRWRCSAGTAGYAGAAGRRSCPRQLWGKLYDTRRCGARWAPRSLGDGRAVHGDIPQQSRGRMHWHRVALWCPFPPAIPHDRETPLTPPPDSTSLAAPCCVVRGYDVSARLDHFVYTGGQLGRGPYLACRARSSQSSNSVSLLVKAPVAVYTS